MSRKYTFITPDIVAKTKRYLEDDRKFSKAEVARLVGIGINSVNKIIQGYYDQPVEERKATQVADSEHPVMVNTEFPYQRIEYLVKCEMFIDELFDLAIKSDKAEDELYFPRHYLHNMCERYFPERTQEKLKDLDTYA